MNLVNHRLKVLITGGNQGIGFQTALQLCLKNYEVTITCRNEEKANEAIKQIKNIEPESSIEYVIVDFSNLHSVLKCAEDLNESEKVFDIIVLNAGVLLPKENRSVDGYEITFQVNFLAQYFLLMKILEGSSSRNNIKVITLTSAIQKLFCRLTGRTWKYKKWWKMFSPDYSSKSGWISYAKSKLAMSILACHLDRMQGISSISVHPGMVKTALSSEISSKAKRMLEFVNVKRYLSTTEEAANNIIEVIEAEHKTGTFKSGKKYLKVSKFARNERNGIELELLSRKMLAEAFKQ